MTDTKRSQMIEHLASQVVRRIDNRDSAIERADLDAAEQKQLDQTIDFFTELAVVSGLPIMSGRRYAQIAFIKGYGGMRPLYVDEVELSSQEGSFVCGRITRLIHDPEPGALELLHSDCRAPDEPRSSKAWTLYCSVANGRVSGSFAPMQPSSPENEESFGSLVLHPRRRLSLLWGSYSRYRDDESEVGPNLTTQNQERPLVWVELRDDADTGETLASTLTSAGVGIQSSYLHASITPIDGEAI